MHLQTPTVRLHLNGLAFGIERYPKRVSIAGWSVTKLPESFAAPQLGSGTKLEFTSLSQALCRQIRARCRIGLY